ncbi:DNA topoisomerase, partial [Nanoarchaeota archaeon]
MKEREIIIKKLEKLGRDIIDALEEMKNPSIRVPIRNRSNVWYDEQKKMILLGDKKLDRYFLNSATARSFMQTLLVAEKIKKLLIENKTISTRQMFYLNRHEIPGLKESAVDNQKETDSVIEDLEVVLDALREKLNLIPTPNGVLAGDIQVEDTTTGDVLDYSKMGAAGGAIPAKVEPDVFKFKRVKAKYVLVVEKFATWNLLNEYRFWKE